MPEPTIHKAEPKADPAWRRGPWRRPDFARLWAGQSISVFGSLVSGTAIPFTAVLLLGATPWQMGLLNVARLLPGFLASPLAGVWVDRLPRRPILIGTDIGRAFLLLIIPVAYLLGGLGMAHLYAVAFLSSILTIFFDVAYQSYMPSLVDREDLVQGNSALTASASVAEVGAFSLAGWLVQVVGGPIAVLIDAVSFMVSAAFVGRIRTKETPPAPGKTEDGTPTGVRAEVAEGVRFVLRDPVLRSLAVALGCIECSWPMFGTVFLLYATKDLGFAPGVLGGIFAVGGAASFVGALAAGPVTRRFGVGAAMVGCVLVFGLGMAIVPLATGATLLSGALLVAQQLIVDPAATIYEINGVSLRQSLAPERMLGRVNAAMRFIGWGAMLAGSLLGGLLGGWIGVRATLVVAALLSMVAGAWLWASPVARLRSVPPREG
jgi:MFS family permease